MTAAVALAVVLVIAVAGVSLAMQTQRPAGSNPIRPRPTPPNPRRPRDRPRPRPQPEAATPPPPPEPPRPEPEPKGPELLRTGAKAEARVVSVVDERTVGKVTRSRLTLEISPADGDAFEVTTRTAFPSPSARASVRVGGRVPVRYDPADHSRVVLDLPPEKPEARKSDGGEPEAPKSDPGKPRLEKDDGDDLPKGDSGS